MRSLLLALPVLGACGDAALMADVVAERGGLNAPGDAGPSESLLVLGIDTDLRTALFRVDGTDADGNPAARASDAEQFVVTEVASLEVGAPSSPIDNAAESAFSPELPYPVPDPAGQQVALLATWVGIDGAAAGRVRVLDLATGTGPTTADLPGLDGVRFLQAGGWLGLQLSDDSGMPSVAFLSVDGLQSGDEPLRPAELEGSACHWAATQGETALVVVTAADGRGEVLRLRPDRAGGDVSVETEWSLPDWSAVDVAPGTDGSSIAIGAVSMLDGRQGVFLVDDVVGVQGPLGPAQGLDCGSPAWNPVDPDELVLACVDPESQRPDLVIVDRSQGWTPLTQVAQPEVPEGSMDLLVFVGRPQWSPDGEVIVFRAVPREESYLGVGATLLAAPRDSGRAWPVAAAGDTSIDWVHFSRTEGVPELLFWDRAASDLSGSSGEGIHLVSLDDNDAQAVPVVLDRPLLVSYPMFLAGNTLFYP